MDGNNHILCQIALAVELLAKQVLTCTGHNEDKVDISEEALNRGNI